MHVSKKNKKENFQKMKLQLAERFNKPIDYFNNFCYYCIQNVYYGNGYISENELSDLIQDEKKKINKKKFGSIIY